MNKLIQITTLALGIALTGCATASPHWDDDHDEYRHRGPFEDTARVIRVTPIYETVRVSVPEERCWKERYYQRSDYGHDDSYTPPIVGAIVGGVVGNQFGRGSGKTAMTVAGSLLGASIARDLNHGDRHVDYRPRHRRRCEVTDRVEEHEEIVAYRVKYRYKGRVFHTRMNHHPGKHIRVRVDVRPID
ncbi:glycine zipper 2TM domain-containing protein [endosymbiont of unidentified scaly snail isolate Monju]|uniref:glycine zipper 2TM domain-containing protein n=1 Tax=endosymbiont of unidentified scaly snail isolate Monju TaxID=1248727 RepID=UPI0003892B90|nr:glycine zipper 2TM domain-containing protein [endosymbiont of unidentified scaly snail isolate Monju]BAN68756.1 hypothetical protein EBS_0813 [endosymbiont of unidentified scaly snail isolate Monju]